MAHTPTLPDGTDYKSFGPAMGERCGDNAANWASAYCQINPEAQWDVMVGWFANAIEEADMTRHGGRPVVLPDGSAVMTM